jgi:hypothetical protein
MAVRRTPLSPERYAKLQAKDEELNASMRSPAGRSLGKAIMEQRGGTPDPAAGNPNAHKLSIQSGTPLKAASPVTTIDPVKQSQERRAARATKKGTPKPRIAPPSTPSPKAELPEAQAPKPNIAKVRASASRAASKNERSTGSVWNPSSREHIMTRSDEKSRWQGGKVVSEKIPVTNPANRSKPEDYGKAHKAEDRSVDANIPEKSASSAAAMDEHVAYWNKRNGGTTLDKTYKQAEPKFSKPSPEVPETGRAPVAESKSHPAVSTSQFGGSPKQSASSGSPAARPRNSWPATSAPARSVNGNTAKKRPAPSKTHPGSDPSVRSPSNSMQDSGPGRIAKASVGALGHGLATTGKDVAKWTGKAIATSTKGDINAARLAGSAIKQSVRKASVNTYYDSVDRGGTHEPRKVSVPGYLGAAARNYHDVNQKAKAAGPQPVRSQGAMNGSNAGAKDYTVMPKGNRNISDKQFSGAGSRSRSMRENHPELHSNLYGG